MVVDTELASASPGQAAARSASTTGRGRTSGKSRSAASSCTVVSLRRLADEPQPDRQLLGRDALERALPEVDAGQHRHRHEEPRQAVLGGVEVHQVEVGAGDPARRSHRSSTWRRSTCECGAKVRDDVVDVDRLRLRPRPVRDGGCRHVIDDGAQQVVGGAALAEHDRRPRAQRSARPTRTGFGPPPAGSAGVARGRRPARAHRGTTIRSTPAPAAASAALIAARRSCRSKSSPPSPCAR